MTSRYHCINIAMLLSNINHLFTQIYIVMRFCISGRLVRTIHYTLGTGGTSGQGWYCQVIWSDQYQMRISSRPCICRWSYSGSFTIDVASHAGPEGDVDCGATWIVESMDWGFASRARWGWVVSRCGDASLGSKAFLAFNIYFSI